MEKPLHISMADILFDRGIDPYNEDQCITELLWAGYRGSVIDKHIDAARAMATIRMANAKREGNHDDASA